MTRHAGVRSVVLAAATGLLLIGAPAHAALRTAPSAGTRTVTVKNAAEAWYASSPVDICTTPLGCPTQPPATPYTAETLHVGLAGGRESSRTYLLPDTSALPVGATVTSALMTLPVADGEQDGTVSPESAHVLACVSTEPFDPQAAGSTAPPPAVDCHTSSAASYDAKAHAFTVNVTSLLAAQLRGVALGGVALLPDPDRAQPTDAWQVSFNSRRRAHVPHISTRVTYAVAAVPPAPVTPTAPPPAVQPPSGGTGGGVALPPVAPLPPSGSVAGQGPAASPPVVAPGTPPAVVTQPVALVLPFQYPMAFLVPLALLAGAAWFVRLFTRDATPVRRP